jgi:hypothetical protein
VNAPAPFPPSRHASHLRRAGILVLLLGLIGGGLIYWLGLRSSPELDDFAMAQYNKPEMRQMQMLYGSQGRLIEDLLNGLKRPGTQALLAIVVTGIIAGGFFYLASRE